ncbi:Chitobiase/beta-hexosaminidase C-terminal domain-containing protein [Arenibacter palladensis]|uniref:Chitobiase/beta-hexosaminidase C-terminal domain-containing protein n=1 Tax=Arenibacter palladensis TaxID=237373 RepID=A0A1M4UH57_9FLAO|nr:alkaline phosphatase family protein [Arenibacter palladensis]SHE56112.1 Chitobiase/beta-hexosaminidase C-terminal domain-containing protein [Arenibacter palladensis]
MNTANFVLKNTLFSANSGILQKVFTRELLHKTIVFMIILGSFWSCAKSGHDNTPIVKHVVVIGFDGLSPNGLKNAITPTFDKVMSEGAYSMHARAVLPTSSSTNWASMIMGAGPEQHGITSNSWEKDNFVLPTVTQSEDFLFPSIFQLIDDQKESAEIGAIYHWSGFGRLFEKGAVDYDINPESEDETAALASAYIKEKKPTFTFIHFDHVDHGGHEYGHGSPEYFKSVEKADALLAEVMAAIKASGMADETLVIISADHGGLGKGHGGESLEEIEIPFILWGKLVKKNHLLNYPVYQYDNAATVAFALGIKTPMAWIGKPVKNAFEGFDLNDDYPTTVRVKGPVILPAAELNKRAGGLFDESATIVMESPNTLGEIRYTMDGSMPNANSKLYTKAVTTSENGVVKSAIFNKGKIVSTVSEAFFRIKNKTMAPPISYEVFYLENLTSIPSLENKRPDAKGTCFEITSDEVKEEIKSNTVVRFRTTLQVENEDRFTFYTNSDDGSKLWVNNELVVDNDGDHGVIEKNGSISLKPGTYPLEVIWFNGGGSGWLNVDYKTNTIPKQVLPTSILK